MSSTHRGFTLIELLVAVSIVAILSAIVFASLGEARSKAGVAAGKAFASSIERSLGADALLIADLDEGTGSQASDKSAHGVTGTITGASWADGISGKALSFSNASDRVTFSAAGKWLVGYDIPFSVSAWIYPTEANPGTMYPVISARYGDTFFFGLVGNSLVFRSDDTSVSASGSIPLNQWTHVAASWSGPTHVASFYINGKAAGSSVAPNDWTGDTSTVYIGYEGRYSYTFRGIIDSARIFDRVILE